MSKDVEVIILSRQNMSYKDSERCYLWDIKFDYIGDEKSSFKTHRKLNAAIGDYIVVKNDETELLENDRIIPLFVGLVDSNDSKTDDATIDAKTIYSMADIDFIATKKTGSSAQIHLFSLIDRYLLSDPTKMTDGIKVRIDGASAYYSYQPNDQPKVENLTEYFIHMFEKTGVVWEVEWFGKDDNGKLVISTVIRTVSKTFQIKNNTADFQNWSVYLQERNKSSENMLLIVDKTTSNGENPIILSTWYYDKSGNVTQEKTNVQLPTKSKIYIYDTNATDKPSFSEVARSELSGSIYAHEIKVDVLINSRLIKMKDLTIGCQVALYFNEVLYKSILTAYSVTSSGNVISLTFGNIRSTVKSLLKG